MKKFVTLLSFSVLLTTNIVKSSSAFSLNRSQTGDFTPSLKTIVGDTEITTL